MGRELGYADAVKLLGGVDSRVVAALDRLTGGLLLAASAGGGALVLNLFEAKGELARLSGELVSGLGACMRGLGRFDRTERLVAAHKVVVITAYFEALSTARLPFDPREQMPARRVRPRSRPMPSHPRDSRTPEPGPPRPAPPDPGGAADAAGFVQLMRALRTWSGMSLRALSETAKSQNDWNLAASSLSDALRADTLPRLRR